MMMSTSAGASAAASHAGATTGSATETETATVVSMTGESTGTGSATTGTSNPLLSDWSSQPFHLPPFTEIQPSHFPEAFAEAMRQHHAELKAIEDDCINMNDKGTTTTTETTNLVDLFERTVAAYDRAGRLYGRIHSVFDNLCNSLNPPEMQQVEMELSPLLSRHESACLQNYPNLFQSIRNLHQQIQQQQQQQQLQHKNDESNSSSSSTTKTTTLLPLTPEQIRLVERVYLDFTRVGGAHLTDESQRTELANLQAELATLSTQFAQNVMQDEQDYQLVLKLQDLQGCPDFLIDAARNAALERGHDKQGDDDVYVITLSRSLVEPFLTFADRRDLRKQVFDAWIRRGELDINNRNNNKVAVQILKLRQRMARLHGYPNFATYQCVDRMAKTPQAVMELLENVWVRAKEAARRELQVMEAYVQQEQEGEGELEGGIQAHDWRYFAEKVRKAHYNMDEALLKPYLSLDSMRDALFAVSNQLFGLRFVKRDDIQSYHPSVDTYEVRETITSSTSNEPEEDRLVALFLHDNFARSYKKSGAWMSEFRTQTRNLAAVNINDDAADPMEGIPIVCNNNNFARGSSDSSTLLSFGDAHTLFHEFGHAHHGILSDATYQRLASTNVLTDFVELPSQLMEHWLDQRPILKQYARHYQTGEPVPDQLLDRLDAARNFQQGFQTVEYTICALLDMALHQVDDYDDGSFDLAEFERTELERLGMPKAIVMRHRPPHFLHLFSSSFYAAGYYVYLWAEVLDKDAFAAFQETGDIFDKETAARLRKYIYSTGNTEAPDELFRRFRGRDPKIEFMLRHKGLLVEEEEKV